MYGVVCLIIGTEELYFMIFYPTLFEFASGVLLDVRHVDEHGSRKERLGHRSYRVM